MQSIKNNEGFLPQEALSKVISCFNHAFENRWRTVLQGGGDEPLYQPATHEGSVHRVIFTRDYIASALHEAAHWCIAGDARRTQIDYGYWYAPDGRNDEQQRLFERVEVEPQAMEWVFSQACGLPFRVSADNLEQQCGPSSRFKDRVYHQVISYCESGMPQRPMLFVASLADVFLQPSPLSTEFYKREMLD